MKLFAFVRRCRRLSSAPVDQAAEEEPAAVAPPAEKRRRRPSGPAWKPTLGAISEDAAVALSAAAKGKAGGQDKSESQRESRGAVNAAAPGPVGVRRLPALRGTHGVAGVRADGVLVLSSTPVDTSPVADGALCARSVCVCGFTGLTMTPL
ncbi:hypothetical protein OsJ_24642 [Oryza sativa Japonica Group]|uniref:Uncharacterized protein n=1 Tax=Oryza sativa subsp. japonica TaxID=39947 RepID=B9FXS3_ORYSJ|nr:hypothetical protein OsJ_24642 [Oryza sativa Japonica Group]